MNIQGEIIVLGQTQEVGSNGFKKRQVVVKTNEQYPQTIPIDFIKDKCSVLDQYKVGDSVDVSINIRGNEWNDKYYVNLQGWRIQNVSSQDNEPHSTEVINEDEQSLPF